jgi:C4-dicarboxylate transporter DctQ subunit
VKAALARLDKAYALVQRRLIFLAFGFMVAITFIGTALRYLPGLPALYWAEEAARYLNIWVVFLASGIAIERSSHLGVDLFVRALPGRGERLVAAAALLLVMGFELLLIVYGAKMVEANMAQLSSALEIPMGWPFLAIPVGGLLMLVATLRRLLAVLRGP